MSLVFRIIRFDSTAPPAEMEYRWDVMGGTLGRSTSNDWVLPDANRYLSGRHATIRCQNGDYYITDTSTNGVFINQKPVPLGRDNSARLEHGDTLKVGGYVIEVLLDSGERTQQPDGAGFPFDQDELPKRPMPGGRRAAEAREPLRVSNPFADEEPLLPEKSESDSSALASDFWSKDDFVPAASANASQIPDDPFFSDGEFLPGADSAPEEKRPSMIDEDPFSGLSSFYQPPDLQQNAADPTPLNDVVDNNLSGQPQPRTVKAEHDAALLSKDAAYDLPDDDPFDFSGINGSPDENQQQADAAPDLGILGKGAVIQADHDQSVGATELDDDPFDFSDITATDSPETTGNHDGTQIRERIELAAGDKPPQSADNNRTAALKKSGGARGYESERGVASEAVSTEVPGTRPADSAAGAEIRRVLAGMGIVDESARNQIAAQVSPEKIGQLFRILLQGSMDVLRTRTEIKSEMRMDVTTIQPVQNNPVKFAVNVDDALLKLLLPQGAAFMEPELALEEAFDDIKAHQVAVIAGVQASLKLVMKRFDPEKLVERLQKQSRIAANIPIQRQAKLWALFEQLYSTIEEEASDDFQRLFGLEFSRAYEKQIAQLDRMRGNN